MKMPIKYNNPIRVSMVFSLLLCCSTLTLGQTDVDALRYSFLQAGGTARSVGIGGALGALGGDFSVLSTNPAGIGVYRANELTFTTNVAAYKTISALQAAESKFIDRKYNLNFNNVGVVFANEKYEGYRWRFINLGFGFNRLANFHQEFFFEVKNPGSISERFLQLANGTSAAGLSAFEEGLAYETDIIYNSDTISSIYYSDLNANSILKKQQTFTSKGALDELTLSLGGNYEEKLYVGATVGIPILRYSQTKYYQEEDEDDLNEYFNRMSFSETFRTEGAGVNLKLGFLYKITQALRAGVAVHTPTYYGLEDTFNSSMTSNISYPVQGNIDYEAESPEGFYEYNLLTPWRVIGSLAFVEKYGFISVDAEFVDYSGAYFNLDTDAVPEDKPYERKINTLISDKYAPALNLRIGGEFRLDKYRVRAGYAMYGSPYNENITLGDGITRNISLGLGYRAKRYFIDLAYLRSFSREEHVPYLVDSPTILSVANEKTASNVMMTVGFRF